MYKALFFKLVKMTHLKFHRLNLLYNFWYHSLCKFDIVAYRFGILNSNQTPLLTNKITPQSSFQTKFASRNGWKQVDVYAISLFESNFTKTLYVILSSAIFCQTFDVFAQLK